MKKSVLLFLVGFTILTGCGKAVDGSKQSQSAAVDPEIPQIESEVSVSASEDNARVTERSPEEIQRELESVPDMITEPTVISGLNIDDIIEFGSYEQDYNKENGVGKYSFSTDYTAEFYCIWSVFSKTVLYGNTK